MSRLRCNWKVSCVNKKYTPWLLANKQPVYLLNFVHCNEFWKTWEVICNLPVSFFPLWNFDGLYWCRERESSLEESSRKSNHQMHYSTRLPGYSIKPVFRIKLKGNKVCKQKLWWLVPGGGLRTRKSFQKGRLYYSAPLCLAAGYTFDIFKEIWPTQFDKYYSHTGSLVHF